MRSFYSRDQTDGFEPVHGRFVWVAILLAVAMTSFTLAQAPTSKRTGWVEVDYRPLLDGRELSHSGESVKVLLRKLDGRTVPPPGERPADRLAHVLLEPIVERYGFVLSDALDSMHSIAPLPLIEIGGLWHSGDRQPAWVELLRSRRYIVESDGEGQLRICVPWVGDGEPPESTQDAARGAWEAAWPVLRHVLAAERSRLESAAPADGVGPALQLSVHAYVHRPERSSYLLGADAWRTTVSDTRPDGTRPPLTVESWQAFLNQGLRLEGARIESDGTVRLIGSRADRPPSLLGRPIELSDLAVAYRAIFHGGLSEPYMSLDRGYSPQFAIVNYGGRLRDTALGMVSLLCDVRFKTFSLGIDIASGRDLREALRERLPEFRSHMERFAAHPDSEHITSQQTRLWFYPDRVDLTVSPQNDVLVFRRVRMSAASERIQGVGGGAGGDVPPWTLATVKTIDRDYDALAEFFPELEDLDQVVRLLSLFTWLRQVEASGRLVPELDVLMTVELPPLTTPRRFPQLLAFNAVTRPGSDQPSEVFDRVPVAEGLERLAPSDGRPLEASRRLERAMAALDRNDEAGAALLAEFGRYDLATLTDTELDSLSNRAERVRMHNTVLVTLEDSQIERVTSRQQQGESLRVFSVGIGGLDLGMGQVLARSGSRSLSLVGLGAGPSPADLGAAASSGLEGEIPVERGARDEWRHDPAVLLRAAGPDHGLGRNGDAPSLRRHFGDAWIRTGSSSASSAGGERQRWISIVSGVDDAETRSRRVELDSQRRPEWIERVEDSRYLRYRMRATSSGFVAELTSARDTPAGEVSEVRTVTALPEGLATLRISMPPEQPTGTPESPRLGIRLDASPGGTPRLLEADFPRALLQRIAGGPAIDRTPGRPLPALQPLPPALGAIQTLMIIANEPQQTPPWRSGSPRIPGEENPVRIARSLTEWSERSSGALARAVVGTDLADSPSRWAAAPRISGPVLLLLPDRPTASPAGQLLDRIRGAWSAGPVASSLEGAPPGDLVVMISDAPPGACAHSLGELARRPQLKRKLLAGWCLAGPVREDLATEWLDEGVLAGFGLAEASVVDLRGAESMIGAMSDALQGNSGARVETLPGPFLWFF